MGPSPVALGPCGHALCPDCAGGALAQLCAELATAGGVPGSAYIAPPASPCLPGVLCPLCHPSRAARLDAGAAHFARVREGRALELSPEGVPFGFCYMAALQGCGGLLPVHLRQAEGALLLAILYHGRAERRSGGGGSSGRSASASSGGGAAQGLLCPFPDCGAPLLAEPSTPSLFPSLQGVGEYKVCGSCRGGLCAICGAMWTRGLKSHAGVACAEFTKEGAQVQSEEVAAVGRGFKVCPRPSCGRFLSHYRGHYCHSVTCACGLHCCFCCLATSEEIALLNDGGGGHLCPQFCAPACDCEECPSCGDGAGGRERCGDYCQRLTEGEDACPPCARGSRAATEA
jgi:hypothetical protein